MRDMKTIIGIPQSLYQKGLYGVEIEVEGRRLPTNLNANMWRVEQDGSLKAAEAWEYVTPRPLSLVEVKASLDYLSLCYKAHNSVIDESIRAGVHVHMNVQDWSIKQLVTFATCYYIVEDILMNWCGPDREGNLFCLRVRDAEFVLFKLLKALQIKNLKGLKDDGIRYSSLNYCSLFKYGSLEFRGMRGTGDLDAIFNWVQIINDLRESSLAFEDPVEVIGRMSGDGEGTFFERLFPNTFHLFEGIDGIDRSIRQATRRVQMIAFGVDWSTISKKSVNPFKTEGF